MMLISSSFDSYACVLEKLFIRVTRLACPYGKISSLITEILVGQTEITVTGPARLLI